MFTQNKKSVTNKASTNVEKTCAKRTSNESKNNTYLKCKAAKAHKPLTEREEAFCVNYLRTFSAQSAARYAGIPNSKCLQEGAKLLSQGNVKNRIKQLKKQQYSLLLIEGIDIVQKYINIAFADLFDFVKLGFTSVSSDTGDTGGTSIVLPNSEEINLHLQDVIDGSLIAEIKQGKDGITIKLADRMKALAWLTDYFELNPADVHRRENDKRKIELAAVRVCQNEDMPNKQGEDELSNDENILNDSSFSKNDGLQDNFDSALKSVTGDIWDED